MRPETMARRRDRAEIRPGWVEQPRGALRRREFRRIARRLDGLPAETGEIWIDCRELSHLDYRIGGEIALLLRRLRSRGVGLRFVGLDRYLLSILHLSLAEEDVEQITEIAEGSGRPSAGTADARIDRFVRRFAARMVSRN